MEALSRKEPASFFLSDRHALISPIETKFKDFNPFLNSLKKEFLRKEEIIPLEPHDAPNELGMMGGKLLSTHIDLRELTKKRPKSFLGHPTTLKRKSRSIYDGVLAKVKTLDVSLSLNEDNGKEGDISRAHSIRKSLIRTFSKKSAISTSSEKKKAETSIRKDEPRFFDHGIGVRISSENDIPKLQKVDYSSEIINIDAILCSMKSEDEYDLLEFFSQVDLLIETERLKEEERPTDGLTFFII